MSKKNIFDTTTGAAQTAAPPQEPTTPAVPAEQTPAIPAEQESTTPEPTAPQAADQEPTDETTTPVPTTPVPTTPVPTTPGAKAIKNPQRVIDANMVNALKPFVSTDESRYVLNGICFTQDDEGRPIAVATTGKALAVVEQLVVSADDYPRFPNGEYGQDTKDEVIVPVKPLLDALKKVPKRSTLPILTTPPLISLKNEKGETTQACIPVTDLDSYTVETTRVVEGRFPNYRQVIPPENQTAIEIVLDANILLDIAQAALAFTKNGSPHLVPVTLCVPFENKAPVRCEVKDNLGRRLTMVTIPLQNCGELINRIDTKALQQVTGRLEEVVGQLLTIEYRKGRKAKAEKAEAADGKEPEAKAE